MDIPKNLIIKVIKKVKIKQSTIKKYRFISVDYTGWIFDKNVSTNNHCDAKGEMFDSNILENLIM